MKPNPAALGQGLVRLLVPIVIIAVIWTLVGAEETLGRLGTLEWSWIILAFAGAVAQIVLSALRWQVVARKLGSTLTAREAIAEYFLAQLVNQTVPGGVVGDAARAVRNRHETGFSRAAQAVMIERMAGQGALWGLLVIGLIGALAIPGGIVWPVSPLSFGIALALLAAGALFAFLMARGRIGVLRRFGRATASALFAKEIRLTQIALTLAVLAVNLASLAWAARATGTLLSLEAIVTILPLILSAMLIPATVAGWGYREGAAAALFPLAGASPAAGLAASLVFGLVVLASSLPGIVVLLGRKGRRQEAEAAVTRSERHENR